MLGDLEQQLLQRFRCLSEQRIKNEWPVFGIEHGLSSDQLNDLTEALEIDLQNRKSMASEHFLVWIAFAVEIGYNYNGEEYWQSFGERLPSWTLLGDRSALKRLFRRFNKDFNGFQPSGRWAEHFSIISWPISNAVLPSSLHRSFARFLHNMRFEVASRQTWTAAEIGEFVSENYYGGSTLLQGMLEQHELTGNIILALRSIDVTSQGLPISGCVLDRLCADIEKVRSSKSNLSDFRHALRTTKMRTAHGLSARTPTDARTPKNNQNELYRRYRPKLVARLNSDGTWKLGLNLQGIAGALSQEGLRLRTMQKVRVRIASNDRLSPIAALRSYAAKPLVEIRNFKSIIARPVLEFEGEAPGLETLKNISIGPPLQKAYLLRIQADGLGNEVVSRHVRRNESYFLIVHDPLSEQTISALGLEKVRCSVADPVTYCFLIGDVIGGPVKKELKSLGLGWKHNIEVYPVGLVPRWEDGANSIIFVEGEQVLLGIRSDSELREYAVSIDDEPHHRFQAAKGTQTLVLVSELPVGEYEFSIQALGAKNTELAATEFYLSVRPRKHWSLAGNPTAGFSVETEPHTVALGDIENGQSKFRLSGLAGESCRVKVNFLNFRDEVMKSATLGHVRLPSTLGIEDQILQKLHSEGLEDSLQNAGSLELDFVIPHIGKITHRLERELKPVRWRIMHDQGQKLIRLVNETDDVEGIVLWRASIGNPDEKEKIKYHDAAMGIIVEAPGHLYFCRHNRKNIAQFYSTPAHTNFRDLSELGIQTPTFSSQNIDDILALIRMHRNWHRASLTGPLAAHRRYEVLQSIELHIFKLLCSVTWVEKMWSYSNRDPSQLPMQQKFVGGSPGFASHIRTNWQNWTQLNQSAIDDFAKRALIYDVTKDARLARLALILALKPNRVPLHKPAVKALLTRLGETPVLWKGAFFAKTVAASHGNAKLLEAA